MARPCSVCSDGRRPAIDQSIVSGTPNRRVAARSGLTEQSIRRHREGHIPLTLLKAQGVEETVQADDLLAQVRELQATALRLLGQAEEAGDVRTALAGVAQVRACLELLAKLLGELDERPQVNLILSPEWLVVRAVLLEALAPYPEARQAVAARLVALEAS